MNLSTDTTWLKKNVSGYASNDDDKHRYGANLNYESGNFGLLGQWLKAEDGDLERDGWFIQPSYKFKLDRKIRDSDFGFRVSGRLIPNPETLIPNPEPQGREAE